AALPHTPRWATVGPMPASAPPPPHPHKWLVRSMLAAALVLAVLGIFAVWANRQVLNADNWANTSSAMLENPAIRTQISDFRLGLPGKLVGKIPPKAGQIKIMSSKQVDAVQGAATLLQILAFLLPAAALGLLAGAVFLSEGRRRQVLLLTGINLIVAGFLVLI